MLRRRIALLAVGIALSSVALLSAEEKVLYEKASPYNTILVTEDSQGLRTLRFERGGARQSVVKPGDPDHLELPYARAILAGFAFCPQAKRVLIVGLGGGTIPSFLRRHYPQLVIDVVELDPGVVEVAQRYFDFREDAKMHVTVGDGRAFLEACQEPYDLIFLDAFDRDSVPYSLTTSEFLETVRNALTPSGAILGNIWSSRTNRLHDAMVRTYQEEFAEVYLFRVPQVGNEILIALPRREPLSSKELARRATIVSREQRFPFDLGELLGQGVEHLETRDPQAKILRDDAEPNPARETPQEVPAR